MVVVAVFFLSFKTAITTTIPANSFLFIFLNAAFEVNVLHTHTHTLSSRQNKKKTWFLHDPPSRTDRKIKKKKNTMIRKFCHLANKNKKKKNNAKNEPNKPTTERITQPVNRSQRTTVYVLLIILTKHTEQQTKENICYSFFFNNETKCG